VPCETSRQPPCPGSLGGLHTCPIPQARISRTWTPVRTAASPPRPQRSALSLAHPQNPPCRQAYQGLGPVGLVSDPSRFVAVTVPGRSFLDRDLLLTGFLGLAGIFGVWHGGLGPLDDSVPPGGGPGASPVLPRDQLRVYGSRELIASSTLKFPSIRSSRPVKRPVRLPQPTPQSPTVPLQQHRKVNSHRCGRRMLLLNL
jgi:hypothetical protein